MTRDHRGRAPPSSNQRRPAGSVVVLALVLRALVLRTLARLVALVLRTLARLVALVLRALVLRALVLGPSFGPLSFGPLSLGPWPGLSSSCPPPDPGSPLPGGCAVSYGWPVPDPNWWGFGPSSSALLPLPPRGVSDPGVPKSPPSSGRPPLPPLGVPVPGVPPLSPTRPALRVGPDWGVGPSATITPGVPPRKSSTGSRPGVRTSSSGISPTATRASLMDSPKTASSPVSVSRVTTGARPGTPPVSELNDGCPTTSAHARATKP